MIEGFRGIEKLTIPRLARVTLLAGKNGAGKTTVLDAIRVYATRGNSSVLGDILDDREEFSSTTDEDDDMVIIPDWSALFFGRDAWDASPIYIGATNREGLNIETVRPRDNDEFAEIEKVFPDSTISEDIKTLQIRLGGVQEIIPSAIFSKSSEAASLRIQSTALPISLKRNLRRIARETIRRDRSTEIKYELLGPGLLSNDDIATLWDRVALTENEDMAVEALKLILGNDVERIAIIGDDRQLRPYPRFGRFSMGGRRALVKLRGHRRPVPMKSLGDGATRLFGVALALANSAGGFLLIDEAENGIHWSIETEFWRMVLRSAQENNVQVLATTHGWDCISGFANAVNETQEEDGLLIRLEREDNQIRVVDYTEEDLAEAAKQRIEVR